MSADFHRVYWRPSPEMSTHLLRIVSGCRGFSRLRVSTDASPGRGRSQVNRRHVHGGGLHDIGVVTVAEPHKHPYTCSPMSVNLLCRVDK